MAVEILQDAVCPCGGLFGRNCEEGESTFTCVACGLAFDQQTAEFRPHRLLDSEDKEARIVSLLDPDRKEERR